MSNLVDPFARAITYLRVSVTDRCDFRCVYCMSEDMTFLPKAEVLSLEELDRLCSAFVNLGVRKLRLTGGEPLVRRNVMSLFRGLARHLGTGALDELTLTTNGSQLPRFADELAELGVKRINVSLDTRDAAKFAAITRWGKYDTVMAGLAAGEVSLLAWSILEAGTDAFMTIPDASALEAMRALADGTADDPPVVAGESAVAGLAAALIAVGQPALAEALGLGSHSRVLVFGTEGATDPELYREIVGRPAEAVRAAP